MMCWMLVWRWGFRMLLSLEVQEKEVETGMMCLMLVWRWGFRMLLSLEV